MKSPAPTTNPQDIIYTPSEIVTLGLNYLDERKKNKFHGLPLGIKKIDADFIPALPGELITIIGRPGNGKTGFMMRWARWRADEIRKAGELNRVVVYITLEQSIEELNAFDIAADTGISVEIMARGTMTDDDREAVNMAANQRYKKPLYLIGHSMERRKKRPTLNIDTIALALAQIESMHDESMAIDAVFVDYLQRIPTPPGSESKTIGLDEVLNRLKDGCLAFGCPFVVGVQAKREVDSYKNQIPEMSDGQWTSGIEQVSDKSFSVCRPRKYRNEGEDFAGIIVQGHNQMIVKLLKQKMGAANIEYNVMFDPRYNRLDEAETIHTNLGGF